MINQLNRIDLIIKSGLHNYPYLLGSVSVEIDGLLINEVKAEQWIG